MNVHDTTGCSTLTRAYSDPIFATAPTSSTTWFLLEWDEDWGSGAVENDPLPASLTHWWNQRLPAVPQSRRLFVRSKSSPSAGRSFIVIVCRPSSSMALEFRWNSPEELLEIDIERAVNGECEGTEGSRSGICLKESFIAVCSNHHHDRCCARGHAVCEAMSSHGIRALEATHIGGHRYAATGIVFPVGQYYGLLSPAVVPALSKAIRDDHVLIDHFRGWICHPAEVQAADYFLRKDQGLVRRTDVVLIESKDHGERRFQVLMEVRPSLQRFEIMVRERDAGSRVVSCGPASNKSKETSVFECEEIRAVSLS